MVIRNSFWSWCMDFCPPSDERRHRCWWEDFCRLVPRYFEFDQNFGGYGQFLSLLSFKLNFIILSVENLCSSRERKYFQAAESIIKLNLNESRDREHLSVATNNLTKLEIAREKSTKVFSTTPVPTLICSWRTSVPWGCPYQLTDKAVLKSIVCREGLHSDVYSGNVNHNFVRQNRFSVFRMSTCRLAWPFSLTSLRKLQPQLLLVVPDQCKFTQIV